MACDCCENMAGGIMYCEDGVVNILEIGPPPTSGGPWVIGYNPTTGTYYWLNAGAWDNPGEGFLRRAFRALFRKKSP